MAHVLERKWLVAIEVCVAKLATFRQLQARRMSSGDGIASTARGGSAKDCWRRSDTNETLRWAAVAFQESAEPLLAPNFGKYHDLPFVLAS